MKIEVYGLARDCSNSIANALELLQPGAKPSKYTFMITQTKRHFFLNTHSETTFKLFLPLEGPKLGQRDPKANRL